MYKDPTEWRDGFKRWKETGELPWDAGKRLPSYQDGKEEYESFLKTLPNNQKTPGAYNTRRYWELNGKPKNFAEAIGRGMYAIQNDNGVLGWHANSVAYNESNDIYEFMKPNYHPTRWMKQVEGYDKSPEFQKDYKVQYNGPMLSDRYIPREKPGFKIKGGQLPKFTDGKESVRVGDYNVYPSAIGASELNVTTPEVVVIGKDRRPAYQRYDAERSVYNSNDVISGFNALTLGGMNNLSPTQWARRFYDAPKLFSGDMSFSDYTNRWLNGNEGIVSREFAKNHPYYSAAINMAGDVGSLQLLKSIPSALRFIDRGFVPQKNILSQTDNTMTRYIGTGDSGYKDALTSDVIRGNINPPRFSAAELAKLRRRFKDLLSEDDFRDLASNNIRSEEQFNRINEVLSNASSSRKVGRFDFGKNYSLADSWEEYLQDNARNQNLTQQQAYMQSFSRSKEINDWIKNWRVSTDKNIAKGHPLPTFALSDEILTNSRQFPGDYAVQIKNADKYARTAEAFGHFKEHPTTYRPMSPFEEDVEMFKRQDGFLTGHKYMVKVPKSQMAKDKALYSSDAQYVANPTIRKGLGMDYQNLLNLQFEGLRDLQKLQSLPFFQKIQTMKSE